MSIKKPFEMNSIYELPILIVDDSQSNVLLITRFLEAKGFTNLSSALHANDALDHLRETPCSLLLLDLHMPDISGLELMKIMADDMSFLTPPTIFVTAETDENILGECFESGAVDFIKKPLDSGIELIARVIKALKHALIIEETSYKIHIDALSKLYNRRYFDERFYDIYKKSVSLGRTFHFLMVDIDDFKPYNDHYGHLAGDVVIKSVASSLQDTLKPLGDLVFRLGGEEFGSLFCTSPGESIMPIIESICVNVESLNIAHINSDYDKITISAGLLSVSDSGYSYSKLYETCDKLLYQAKEAGKNQVIHMKL